MSLFWGQKNLLREANHLAQGYTARKQQSQNCSSHLIQWTLGVRMCGLQGYTISSKSLLYGSQGSKALWGTQHLKHKIIHLELCPSVLPCGSGNGLISKQELERKNRTHLLAADSQPDLPKLEDSGHPIRLSQSQISKRLSYKILQRHNVRLTA